VNEDPHTRHPGLGGLVAAGGAAIAAETIWGTIGGRVQQQMPLAVFPAINGGQFYTMQQPKQLFVYDFGESTLNTTFKWSTSTANSGVVAANGTCPGASCGAAVLGTGTTANGISVLSTQLLFNDRNPGYNRFQTNINLPAPGTINQYLSWGFSSVTASTTGLSATNPCGTSNSGAVAASFGFTTAGKLQAFTCASGNFQLIADLSVQQSGQPVQTSPGIWTAGCGCLPQPPDTASYKYLIDFRGDNINWYTEASDGTISRVAYTSRGAPGPDVNQMSVAYVALGAATPPASSSNIQVNQTTVCDTAGNPVVAVPVIAGSTASTLVLKASSGALISAYATCTAACWLMIFNSTSTAGLPATTTPTTAGSALNNMEECIPITTANGIGSISYIPGPYSSFSAGIVAAISSTGCATYTTASTGFIHALVQ